MTSPLSGLTAPTPTQVEIGSLAATVRRHQAALNGIRGTRLDPDWLQTATTDTARVAVALQETRRKISLTDDLSLHRDFHILSRDLACLRNRALLSRIQQTSCSKKSTILDRVERRGPEAGQQFVPMSGRAIVPGRTAPQSFATSSNNTGTAECQEPVGHDVIKSPTSLWETIMSLWKTIKAAFCTCGEKTKDFKKSKVIVIGGGLGGLQAAKGLAKDNIDLLVIDKSDQHVFQPLLFQVASAKLDPSMIATPISDLLHSQKNASVLKATVTAVDKVGKKVILSDGQELPYDHLIVAPGTRHSYFEHPEWEAHAPGLKTIQDALRIQEVVSQAFKRAELSTTPEEAIQHLRFVVIGGGPTGVELAGAIAEIAKKTITKNIHKIKPEDAEIYLIERNNQVLTSYPSDLSKVAHRDLEDLGVKVLFNKHITNVTADRVRIGDEDFETRNAIWAAGTVAPAFLQTLDAPLDKQGRVIVGPDLTIPGHPEVFVIGDAAHTRDKQGHTLPGVAQVAMQQGSFAASMILQETPIEKRRPFEYFDKGNIAIIGRARAVLKSGFIHLSGFFAWLIWSVIHIWYLEGHRNRIRVLDRWIRGS